MKIGIDARCLEWSRGGVSRIILNLLEIWTVRFPHINFYLYFTHEVPKDLIFRHNVHCRLIAGPVFLKRRRIIVEQVLLPFLLYRDKLDKFFATWYTAPLILPKVELLVGAWDISYTTHPSHYNIWNRISLGFFSRIACLRATKIITCSLYDKQQIVKFYKICPNDIYVLILNADKRFFESITNLSKAEVTKKYNLPKKFVLSLGVIHNRRNVDKLIYAFELISDRFPDFSLVVVGNDKTKPKPIIKNCLKGLLKINRASYIEWVDDKDLPTIYALADLYVCTSTVDGETILLKEAMAAGTPIMTSPILYQTVGEHCYKIDDPDSVESTVNALVKFFERGKDDNFEISARKFVESIHWEDSAINCAKFIKIPDVDEL